MDYIHTYRDKDSILSCAKALQSLSQKLPHKLKIMEVCGGHTHTLMKYGLTKLLPPNIEFIHGPGCPVCVMPKGRIDEAHSIAKQENVILLTLGDMIKVPGSQGSLQKTRAQGADVRFLYSPFELIQIAKDNPQKHIVYFAIGFETTTPMTAALIESIIAQNLNNVSFHSNHILVPPPLNAILDSKDCSINAIIAPSHASAISGSKIYEPILQKFQIPIVVSGFEPLDMMQSVLSLCKQVIDKKPKVEIQYSRIVSFEGNTKAQNLISKYFTPCAFEWRGLGEIEDSGLALKEEFAYLDARKKFDDILPKVRVNDSKACICGEILKGNAKPYNCKVFGKSCTPTSPIGSCMVSSEGACAVYYKYGEFA